MRGTRLFKKTTQENRQYRQHTLAEETSRTAAGAPLRVGGQKRRSTAMRMWPKLAAGAAAAAVALTASAGASATPVGTPAVPVAARHAPADTRFTELLALSQVKRAVAWAEVERAWAQQPRTGTSRLS